MNKNLTIIHLLFCLAKELYQYRRQIFTVMKSKHYVHRILKLSNVLSLSGNRLLPDINEFTDTKGLLSLERHPILA